MTPEQARAAAVTAVRSQQGLSKIPPSDWTYEQRTAYNKALAAYILTYPTGFTSADAGTAAHISSKTYQPLEDESFDWGMFGSELGKEAGAVASGFKLSLGTGIALGVAAVAVLAFLNRPSR